MRRVKWARNPPIAPTSPSWPRKHSRDWFSRTNKPSTTSVLCLRRAGNRASRPGHRALARSSLLRDWFPCAGAVLSLAQTHRGQTADDLDELIHSDHWNHHRKKKDSKFSLFVAGIVMASAIALHNVPEGMTIGASYANNNGTLGATALVLAILIGLHNIPEGMAVSVPLISGGMKRWKAVCITALSGIPTVLGALLGYAIGEIGMIGLALSLGFASGAMLYVVFGEILPQAILMYRSKLPAFSAIVGMLVGLFIIYY